MKSLSIIIKLCIFVLIFVVSGCGSSNKNSDAKMTEVSNPEEVGAIAAVPTDDTAGKWEIYKNLENHIQSNIRNEIVYPNYYLIFSFMAPDGMHDAQMSMNLRKRNGIKKYEYVPNGNFKIYFGDLEPFDSPNSFEFVFPESYAQQVFDILDRGSFEVKIVNVDENITYNFTIGKHTLGASEAYSQIKDLKMK